LLIRAYTRLTHLVPLVGELCPLLKGHKYWADKPGDPFHATQARVHHNENQARWFAAASGAELRLPAQQN
jgi:hypothetical protein